MLNFRKVSLESSDGQDAEPTTTTSFLPNVASLHAPISIAYSKIKNDAPQLSGERKTVKKYVLGVYFPHQVDTYLVGMRHQCGGMRQLFLKKILFFEKKILSLHPGKYDRDFHERGTGYFYNGIVSSDFRPGHELCHGSRLQDVS